MREREESDQERFMKETYFCTLKPTPTRALDGSIAASEAHHVLLL